MAAQEWHNHHAPKKHTHHNSTTGRLVPSHLYTDENPATTIKGTGFKNRRTAERTIHLTSQPNVRYKQYWTVKTNRERAAHHPHQTDGMRDAIEVFDDWLKRYTPPSSKERRELEGEWRRHRLLCASAANGHGYGKEPSEGEVKRARGDLRTGRECLGRCLQKAQTRRCSKEKDIAEESLGWLEVPFPLVSFTALFGGPGMHGYGEHIFNNDDTAAVARVVIEGMDGLLEIIPKQQSLAAMGPSMTPKTVTVYHYRNREMARAEIQYDNQPPVARLDSMWKKPHKIAIATTKSEHITMGGGADGTRHRQISTDGKSWTCTICTYVHIGESKQLFLACELCGAPSHRQSAAVTATTATKGQPSFSIPSLEQSTPSPAAPSVSTHPQLPVYHRVSTSPPPISSEDRKCRSAAAATTTSWGSLRAPSNKDITGPCKRRKVLDPPPPLLDYIIVLDFEWTADDNRKLEPIAEITQFPSVVMKIVDTKEQGVVVPKSMGKSASAAAADEGSPPPLPTDLTEPISPDDARTQQDAHAVSIFDTFVRPTLNPTLTQFSIDLTGINQAQVDTAPSIDETIQKYTRWLTSLRLVDELGHRRGNWCFATWGNADIASTLRTELSYKSIALPPYFDRWINLKDNSVFRKHYGREPRGGLRFCVESVVGARWEGRAHNGLVDSINTAKIVRDMVRGGFRFTRATRGLDGSGISFRSKHRFKKRGT